MKELKHFTAGLLMIGTMIWAGLVLTGCQSPPVYADFPQTAPVTGNSGNHQGGQPAPYSKPVQDNSDVLFIGDVVTINFNSGDSQILPQHQETIKDDGRITPPFVGSIVAKGKSPGELQADLQKLYDKLYRNMTVTVSSKDRYYSVSGEVKIPGPKPYLGKTDLVTAISSAGDFTEFAKKNQIRLNRANGKTETLDYYKALDDTKQNVPIFPGDTIIVPRRLF